ncbi:MAG: sigma-70 family RNA polymerase sigma factor, partial [Planctomycetota bacterium]
HDLRLFIEDLTETASVRVEDTEETVYTVDDLAKQFSVSTKTISRWRDQGLVSRRFMMDGRRRVGFLQSSVDRFVAGNKDKIKRGEKFRQLTPDEKGEMIERARHMSAGGANMSEVARRLAAQMNRSPETIRYTLKGFDLENESVAIFPNNRGDLNPDDKRSIYRLHTEGWSTAQLCKRFGKSSSSIQRVLSEMRAGEVLNLPLDYIYNTDFERPEMADEILAEMPEPASKSRRVSIPSDLPPYLAALYDVPLLDKGQEQHLFRKMNYLKHRASRVRDHVMAGKSVRAEQLREIEQLYEDSVAVKNQIVQANLRLVVSIAKRHLDNNEDFFVLVSDGNISLIRAVEKFDYSRGNKFSTYASWAIMKNYARSIPKTYRHQDRFRTIGEEVFQGRQDYRKNPLAEENAHATRRRELGRIMNRLDDREQKIIQARYGLGREAEPKTLKQVGEEMGVTKERIRQLEAEAMAKLRLAADEVPLDVE